MGWVDVIFTAARGANVHGRQRLSQNMTPHSTSYLRLLLNNTNTISLLLCLIRDLNPPCSRR